MEKIKLLCIPYAGGMAYAYSNWQKYFEKHIEIVPIELSGRGSRYSSPLLNDMRSMVNDVYNIIKDDINKSKYMFFGHSMGALITYELVRTIQKKGDNMPLHVFFSGSLAPNIKSKDTQIYKLQDDDFIEKIYELGGTPKELLEEKDLLKVFIPILRSDYELIDKYHFSDEISKINVPVSVFYGTEDNLTKNRIEEWTKYIDNKCDFFKFQGGHFFINDKIDEIAKIVFEKCKNIGTN